VSGLWCCRDSDPWLDSPHPRLRRIAHDELCNVLQPVLTIWGEPERGLVVHLALGDELRLRGILGVPVFFAGAYLLKCPAQPIGFEAFRP